MRLIFQIGFNKCATTSLDWIFLKSGYAPLSTSGQYWKRRGKLPELAVPAQIHIKNNIDAGKPPLTALEKFDGFFDMEYVRPHIAVENYLDFKTFAQFYPDAYFLLNTRDVDDWITSRLNHGEGLYLAITMTRLNLDKENVISMWRKNWDEHHESVRSFFADGKHKFQEFHITKTPLSDLVEFVRPDFELKTEFWQRKRLSKAR